MSSPKAAKILQKQKKPSDSKANTVFQYRLANQRGSNLAHHRSSSGDKSKKPRTTTGFDEYQTQHSNQKKFRKTMTSKKLKGNYVLSNKNLAYESQGMQSNKNSAKKNNQLKILFNKNKHNQEHKNKKKQQKNHPILKFVNNRNKDQPITPSIKYPNKLEKQKAKTKTKKSDSKSHRLSSKKRIPSLSLKKNEIKLKTKESDKNYQEQGTMKTIKKRSKGSKNKIPSFVNDEDQSSISQNFGLTDQEEQIFGNRFPFGFEKIKLLGRGGFSLVWLGRHSKSGKQFAVKQIITSNTHQTHLKQIWFGSNFFTLGGIPKPEFAQSEGIDNLVRIYSYEIREKDSWIFYEMCGSSLGSSLYDIKSQRMYGIDQRIYKMIHKPLYQQMQKNQNILKKLTLQICKSLTLLSECEIVHSDLKTQNILIRYQPDSENKLKQVKLIDYGSSFEFKEISQFSMATPEYIPPEILNYILHQNNGQYEQQLYQEVIDNYHHPWAIDIFSLGCVILQIVIGVPLWMSLPLLVPNKYDSSFTQKEGLFASKGRQFNEIIKKQRKVIKKLDLVIENENYSKIVLSGDMKRVLKGMLQINYNQRISPQKVIQILQNQQPSK